MGKTITVEIDTSGNATVITNGYKGKSCKDATKQIEESLGVTTSDKDTPEMREIETKAHGRNKATH